ncbi:ABC transporter permease [Cryomorpha ignava]|uniref:Transport permease protein n=1 Tax=Cryomorpha ignava TaxID=101383 RepID=A0A7K3WV23_9FLAO|nr:ABC transporter permease [Cryomorpha ignava]NEN24525.1 ABC transporter permease [Cryomorpha ignava]
MSELEKRVYTSQSNVQHPWKMIKDMLQDIKRGQDLAKRLTIRDIKALYRQSFLGVLWAFIIPIANTLTWILLNASGIIKLGESTSLPYPIYVFTGTMIWAMFLESMQSPINLTTQNKSVLAKVNFPREAIIMSAVYQSLFNASIKTVILVIALAFLGYFGGYTLLLFPLAMLSMVLIGTTIGLMLTPISTLYTDISKGLPLIMQFLMYTAPVIYAIPKEGRMADVIRANPLTPLIETARSWLTGSMGDFLPEFFIINAINLLLLAFMFVAYRLALPILIERMNA